MNTKSELSYIATAGDIIAAYVSHNHVASADLPRLIGIVHAAIVGLASGRLTGEVEPSSARPNAAEIRKSVRGDGLVSFLDGRSYKTLKRHLTAHGLTPERYRTRYGLPDDYPMVCATYSEKRSGLAKAIGLGVPGGRVERRDETRSRKAA